LPANQSAINSQGTHSLRHSVKEVTLSNGAKGLFVHVPGASVMTFEFNFRAGDFLCETGKWETAHLMEHMVLGANERIPKAREFQAEFEKNGAYCNASTGSYDIIYESECADFEWERIADNLIIAISKPLFLEGEFKSEYSNVREELTGRKNNHFRHLSLSLQQAYGFAVKTDQERLKLMSNVTTQDVRKHYTNTHTLSNLRFVISGKLTDVRESKLIQMIESMELPKGNGRIDLPDETPSKISEHLYIANRTIDNFYFYTDMFVQHKLSRDQADALGLVNNILTETLHSRILGEAREQGLVYSMSSNYSIAKKCSGWWFGAQVTSQNAPALFNIISKELTAARNGDISQSDISAAKQYSLGRFQRGGQTVGGVASGYAWRYFFDGTVNDYSAIPDRIRSVTRENIEEVVASFVDSKIKGIGFLGAVNKDTRTQLADMLI
jgi:predicted Zn-dependent peptidase